MFAIPKWEYDEEMPEYDNQEEVSVEIKVETPKKKDRKKKKDKGMEPMNHSNPVLTKLTKVKDAYVNSPGFTQKLVEDEDEDDDEETPIKSKRKKNKKNKKKKGKDEKTSSLASAIRSSTSSLADAVADSPVGSLLSRGIRFASFDDFCKFVDGSGKKEKKEKKEKKKRKREEEEDNDDVDNGNQSKKQKLQFDVSKLKSVLESQSNSPAAAPSKSENKLKSSRFRYLNEQLYTQTGAQSLKMFRRDPSAFTVYHEGYMEQLNKWPDGDPLQKIVASIMKRSDSPSIADFGCGEARLARALPSNSVASLDLVACNDLVTACDMAETPLESESVDIVVFCLSLMGTNLRDYLKEANRVLKTGGTLKIAEVASRFTSEDGDYSSVDSFVAAVVKFGFTFKWKEGDGNDDDKKKSYFVFMDFKKRENAKKKKLPEVSLKPCMYKKR